MAGGRPMGRVDNPYNKRKPRDETEEEKKERIQKTVDTKKQKKAAAAAAAAKTFFQPRRAVEAPQHNAAIYDADLQDAEAETGNEENDITVMNETITVTPAIDVVANLDINDGQPTEDGSIDDDDTDIN